MSTNSPLIRLQLWPDEIVEEFDSIDGLLKRLGNEANAWHILPHLQTQFTELKLSVSRKFQQQPTNLPPISQFLQGETKSRLLIFSESAAGKAIQDVVKAFGAVAGNGAYKQIAGHNHDDALRNQEYLLGAVAGAIYKGAGQDREVGAQLSAAAGLRKELFQVLDTHKQTLEEFRQRGETQLSDQENVGSKRTKEFEDIFAQQQRDFETRFSKSATDWGIEAERLVNQLRELEKLYAEKLRLSKPVEEWEKLEKDYHTRGMKWLATTVGLSVAFGGMLSLMLYWPPQTLNGGVTDPGAVRGIVILAVVISVGVFLIRQLVKLTISAFHLSRDARERARLTYFYLALLNDTDKGITEEQRRIVFQALFSRADTGLLRSDGPSMPGGSLDAIVGNLRGPSHK